MSHIFFLAEINLFRNECYQPCVDSCFLDSLSHSALLNVTHIDQITKRNYIKFFEIARSRATFVKQLPFGTSTCNVDTLCTFKHHKKCWMIRFLYPIVVVMHGKVIKWQQGRCYHLKLSLNLMEDMLASSHANSGEAFKIMEVRSSKKRGTPSADSREHPSAGERHQQQQDGFLWRKPPWNFQAGRNDLLSPLEDQGKSGRWIPQVKKKINRDIYTCGTRLNKKAFIAQCDSEECSLNCWDCTC